jgi:chromosome segregation ATPase
MPESAHLRLGEWEQWRAERGRVEPRRGRLRGLFGLTSADAALEEAIAFHERELELRAAQLGEAIADLERREARTRELRTTVEQMLRRGSAELDERHAELTALASQLAERESTVTEDQQDLVERRSELGAVELRRATVERREVAASEREHALEALAVELERREQAVAHGERLAAELAARARELDSGQVRLEATRAELDQQGRALAAREAALQAREQALADAATREPVLVPEPSAVDERSHLAFVPGDRYRLVELEGPAPAPGAEIAVAGRLYAVARLAPSPLPGDNRRCVLLESRLGPSAD